MKSSVRLKREKENQRVYKAATTIISSWPKWKQDLACSMEEKMTEDTNNEGVEEEMTEDTNNIVSLEERRNERAEKTKEAFSNYYREKGTVSSVLKEMYEEGLDPLGVEESSKHSLIIKELVHYLKNGEIEGFKRLFREEETNNLLNWQFEWAQRFYNLACEHDQDIIADFIMEKSKKTCLPVMTIEEQKRAAHKNQILQDADDRYQEAVAALKLEEEKIYIEEMKKADAKISGREEHLHKFDHSSEEYLYLEKLKGANKDLLWGGGKFWLVNLTDSNISVSADAEYPDTPIYHRLIPVGKHAVSFDCMGICAPRAIRLFSTNGHIVVLTDDQKEEYAKLLEKAETNE